MIFNAEARAIHSGTAHCGRQQKRDGSGLLYYHARYYDSALAKFISPDTIVPGASGGSIGPDGGVAAAGLTVSLVEDAFAGAVAEEHRGLLATGFFDAEAKPRSGPGNPQALNRYSYVLNGPVRWVDPSGHSYDKSPITFRCNGAAMQCRITISPGKLVEWANRIKDAGAVTAVVAAALIRGIVQELMAAADCECSRRDILQGKNELFQQLFRMAVYAVVSAIALRIYMEADNFYEHGARGDSFVVDFGIHINPEKYQASVRIYYAGFELNPSEEPGAEPTTYVCGKNPCNLQFASRSMDSIARGLGAGEG